jgi:hypothetical protein
MPKTASSAKDPYAARFGVVELLEPPSVNALMVSGTGNPNTAPAYKEAVEALYAVSYALRFGLKRAQGLEYKVRPLEGLWQDNPFEVDPQRTDLPRWTMLITQPPEVTPEWMGWALEEVRRKKKRPALEHLRFETLAEGLVVQTLHVGPFSSEPVTVARLREFMAAQGLQIAGTHHEIYLSDIGRTRPERWRTILRYPVSHHPVSQHPVEHD